MHGHVLLCGAWLIAYDIVVLVRSSCALSLHCHSATLSIHDGIIIIVAVPACLACSVLHSHTQDTGSPPLMVPLLPLLSCYCERQAPVVEEQPLLARPRTCSDTPAYSSLHVPTLPVPVVCMPCPPPPPPTHPPTQIRASACTSLKCLLVCLTWLILAMPLCTQRFTTHSTTPNHPRASPCPLAPLKR